MKTASGSPRDLGSVSRDWLDSEHVAPHSLEWPRRGTDGGGALKTPAGATEQIFITGIFAGISVCITIKSLIFLVEPRIYFARYHFNISTNMTLGLILLIHGLL